MGTRGPAPTPTALRVLHGSDRAARRKSEPTPEQIAPICPTRLAPKVKVVWKYIVRELKVLGLASKADKFALERYCRLVIEERTLDEWVTKNGLSYPIKSDKGEVKCLQQFPQVAQMNCDRNQLSKLEAQLGLSSSARTRINVEPQEKPEAVRKRTRGA